MSPRPLRQLRFPALVAAEPLLCTQMISRLLVTFDGNLSRGYILRAQRNGWVDWLDIYIYIYMSSSPLFPLNRNNLSPSTMPMEFKGTRKKRSALDTTSSRPEGDHRKRRRNRTTQSCLNCHTSKRMCDRKRPCGRCTQLGLVRFNLIRFEMMWIILLLDRVMCLRG